MARITAAVTALTLGTGLLVAAPAAAAITLPAGCTGWDGSRTAERIADVTDLICAKPANGLDLGRYVNLESLQIGRDMDAPAPKLTRLPKLPASLRTLTVHAPSVSNVDSLRQLTNLKEVSLQTKALASFTVLEKSKRSLTHLDLAGNYWGRNLSPLSGYANLRELNVSYDALSDAQVRGEADFTATEGSWVPARFPRGLDGKYLLPANGTVIDEKNKRFKAYSFNAKTGKVRHNTAGGGGEWIEAPFRKSAKQPRLTGTVNLRRNLTVNQLADWGHDPKNTIVFSGAPAVGQTLKARHKNTDPFKQYADAFRWYRNGTPIKGATRSSYKLTKADLGKKITLKATDNKMEFGFGGVKYVPVSRTFTATKKVLKGFTTHRPVLTGYTNIGSTLKIKMKSWSPKPTTMRYQWLRDGKVIKGATRKTYKMTSKDAWKSITVKVSGSRKGHATLSQTNKTGKLGLPY